jgi:hypothetical protein
MMPHLGVLSTVHPAAATEVFEKDCLVRLGTCVAPVFGAKLAAGTPVLEVEIKGEKDTVKVGDLQMIELAEADEVQATLIPARGVDIGAGPGIRWSGKLRGGVVGLVFDARGRRPMAIPTHHAGRVEASARWSEALGLYPG